MNEIMFLLEKDNACQRNYFYGIADILNKFMDGYSIIMTADFMTLPMTKFKKIVLLVCEDGQKGALPYLNYPDVVAVFRFYSTEWGCDYKYVFPIPIGYNCRTEGRLMERMYPEKKLSERRFDIFYSGQTLPCRKELERRLDDLKSSFNVFSQVNPMFRLGFNIDEYYRLLGDSRICVVPDGTSMDTFRYTEACGSGCIVITTTKPDLWYYKYAPVVFIKSWSELTKELVGFTLSVDIDAWQGSIMRYYERNLSEKAVANYILKCLKRLTN